MAGQIQIVEPTPKLSKEEREKLESALETVFSIMDRSDLTTVKLSGDMDVNRQRAAK